MRPPGGDHGRFVFFRSSGSFRNDRRREFRHPARKQACAEDEAEIGAERPGEAQRLCPGAICIARCDCAHRNGPRHRKISFASGL